VQRADVVSHIRNLGLVPIVRVQNAELAIAAVEALRDGGIDCVEITMTVEGAIRALETVAERYGGNILLGAGTVLDPETARICILAGARFLVTPSLNVKTIEMARRYGCAIFPGALTPTEILSGWEAGADGIKVFPCQAMGGASYVRALKAPFPHIELFPTGGVKLETIAEFLKAGSMAVGVGSELVDSQALLAGNSHGIAQRARQFREAVESARGNPTNVFSGVSR
jgi:2-dehydro-3-deoxyphosphogluconate aldolase/(4S)-4-hydroxy-2-oxoglutarate aldolase